MQAAQTNPIARSDTLLGVCQAIGDDFGFNPIWLRLAFALPLMFFPVGVFSAYLGLGVVVMISRLLVRGPRRSKAAPEAEIETAHEATADEETDQYPLPIAA
jgi:phage shock protein PspC (stress-responsive transcriptional regulator)